MIGSVRSRARTRLDALRRSYRAIRAGGSTPLPTVRLELRAAVPAWCLRLLLLALGVAVVGLLHPGTGVAVILTGVLVVVVLRPGGTVAALWCGGCGVAWTLSPGGVDVTAYVLIALVSAVFALSTTLGPIPWRARIEAAALRPGLARYLVIQAVAQTLTASAFALQAQQLRLLAVAVVAAAVAAVLAWVLLPRLDAGTMPDAGQHPDG